MSRKKLTEWVRTLYAVDEINLTEFIRTFGNDFPLLRQLKDTPQDQIWHAEGDVHVHTQMVLDELSSIIRKNQFADEERQALWLGALFHDIGKVYTTKEVEHHGRQAITAKHHEDLGRSVLALQLSGLELSESVYLAVLGLIGEHQTPKQLVLRDGKPSQYALLSRKVSLKLLYWLEQADIRGRICNDMADQLEYLELFAEEAKAIGCWDGSFLHEWEEQLTNLVSDLPQTTQRWVIGRGVHDLCMGTISDPSEAVARSFDRREKFSEVILTSGISGSGKSTWISKEHPDGKVISLDSLRKEILGSETDHSNEGLIIQSAIERLKEGLRIGDKIIWDSTGLRRDFRQKVLTIAHDYKALTKLVVFVSPVELCRKQNQQRLRQVPDDIIAKQVDKFQFPLREEAHEIQVLGIP